MSANVALPSSQGWAGLQTRVRLILAYNIYYLYTVLGGIELFEITSKLLIK